MHSAQARALRRAPFGQYRDQPMAPQAHTAAIVEELSMQLAGQAGIRVSDTTSSNRKYFGGEMAGPQVFIRPPAGPNSPEVLELAPVKLNARAALSRNRGRPPGA